MSAGGIPAPGLTSRTSAIYWQQLRTRQVTRSWSSIIYYEAEEVARSYRKHALYVMLKQRGIDYRDHLSKMLLPDDAIYVIVENTMFIVELKFQNVRGSVDEKLQTCDFKKKQYRKLFAPLNYEVEYIYVLTARNKLDMFAAIQGQKVVLVNTSKALLKTDASALFGRYMIAQVMAAAFERVAVPYSERKPAYLVIDEAAEYFDDSLESLLSQARKFQLGVLFAHQHMEQLTPALRSSVASNTSIKMAGGVSDRDARLLDADMRTSNEFIASMRKGAKSTEFAAYVRNETPTAVRIEVPFGTMEAAPRMSNSEHRRLIERNRARYSADPFEAARDDYAEPTRSHPPASSQG